MIKKINEIDNKHIRDYLTMLYGDNKSKYTVINYRSDLIFYEDWLKENNKDILTVTLLDLNNFKVYLRDFVRKNGKGYAQATINRRIIAVREFYKHLKQYGIIEGNPAEYLDVPKAPTGKKPVYLKEDEVRRLITATVGETHEERDRAIIVTFITTGLRVSELHNLNIGDIDNKKLTVNNGKGNKTREIYINDLCKDAIINYLNNREFVDGDALFTSQKGNRLAISTIQHTISKYVVKAKVNPSCSTHGLRHTSATLMLANDVDLRTIQDILGHSSLSTTQKYTHVLDKNKQKASEVMENVLSMSI